MATQAAVRALTRSSGRGSGGRRKISRSTRLESGCRFLRWRGPISRLDVPPRLGGSGEAVLPCTKSQPPTGEHSGAEMASVRATERTGRHPRPNSRAAASEA